MAKSCGNKMGKGGKASAKKVTVKKMADGGMPPKGKPNRKVFKLDILKSPTKRRYSAVTKQAKVGSLERSAPSVRGTGANKNKVTRTVPKSRTDKPTRHGNTRFL